MSLPRLAAVVLATAVGLAVLACAPTKVYTADALPAEQLHFRWGGGFTGEYQAYLLLPNGQLFHKREVVRELPYREVSPVEKSVAKELFRTYEDQGFAALDYRDPGNVTYTVTHVLGADTARMMWGGGQLKPKQEVQSYWRRAMGVFEGKADAGASR